MKTTLIIILALLITSVQIGFSQNADSTLYNKEYTNIEEALKEPEKVFRLNLSDQTLKLDPVVWLKFENLEYLSLKNDHLKEIPREITSLSHLKTLELSGNDFETLPVEFDRFNQFGRTISQR